jgi:hypothetical protein
LKRSTADDEKRCEIFGEGGLGFCALFFSTVFFSLGFLASRARMGHGFRETRVWSE